MVTNDEYGHSKGEVELENVSDSKDVKLERRSLSRRENHPYRADSAFIRGLFQFVALCYKNYILLVRNCTSSVSAACLSRRRKLNPHYMRAIGGSGLCSLLMPCLVMTLMGVIKMGERNVSIDLNPPVFMKMGGAESQLDLLASTGSLPRCRVYDSEGLFSSDVMYLSWVCIKCKCYGMPCYILNSILLL